MLPPLPRQRLKERMMAAATAAATAVARPILQRQPLLL